jgi:uncharacterized membrane protein
MPKHILAYLISTPLFLAIDFVWLAFISKGFYQKQIGHLLAKSPNILAAVTFYVVFTMGLVYFAINPAVQKGSVWVALLNGALFGFFTYMAYDATNFATLKNWPILMVLVDVVWGITICSVVSVLSFLVMRRVG